MSLDTQKPPTTRSLRADQSADLLTRIALSVDVRERSDMMDQVVVLNMGIAEAVVARYRGRGVATEDLQQVAYLALVKSVQRYDDTAGNNILSYAVPTMRGEIRRYFRDLGWMVRPPRRIQELQHRISLARPTLTFALGRSPSPRELAADLGVELSQVNEALNGEGCFRPASLDRPSAGENSTSFGDLIGFVDVAQDAAEARVLLGPAVQRLTKRDRRVLMLRFVRGWTQKEISQDIGVTQMQVSRLLTRILAELREDLGQVS
jgi:RNA polymerase sigma-B factor